MDYDTKLKILFIGIFIWLIYLLIFGILHGKTGMLVWLVWGVIIALVVGAVINQEI